MDTIIENCKLINKTGNFNVGIKNGKIAKISKIPFEGSKKIDIKGNLLLPGFIDPPCSFMIPRTNTKRRISKPAVKVRLMEDLQQL